MPSVTYRVATGSWVTASCFRYEDIIIPGGFECDLSSVPRVLWWLIAPFELSIKAPLVHDFLYKAGGFLPVSGETLTRKDVDELFLRIMREEQVAGWRSCAAYTAVRLFGGKAWQG